MGHPLGATGAMLLTTVLDELERRDPNTAMITLCVVVAWVLRLLLNGFKPQVLIIWSHLVKSKHGQNICLRVIQK